MVKSEQMTEILDFAKKRSINVLVDETYVEFTEELQEITAIPLCKKYDNLVVIRSTSKFFASPGLRLGYAVCAGDEILSKVKMHKNPWAVSTLAAKAFLIMLTDTEYIERTKELISSERKRITHILEQSFAYYPYRAYANFVLVRIVKEGITSDQVFDAAMKKGMMIRDCSDFLFLGDRFIRFCFMEPEDNDRLLDVLMNI